MTTEERVVGELVTWRDGAVAVIEMNDPEHLNPLEPKTVEADMTGLLRELDADLVRDAGGEAAPFSADVTTNEDCAAMVAEAVRRWGRLDVLDNNVGIGSRHGILDETDERWERLWRVNVHSMVLAIRHAVPAMAASGDGGAIVNVSSISALRPRGLTAYSTTKGAVIALTKAAAVDCARLGVRVNCVAPGPAFTPMVAAGGMSDEARERRRLSPHSGSRATAGTWGKRCCSSRRLGPAGSPVRYSSWTVGSRSPLRRATSERAVTSHWPRFPTRSCANGAPRSPASAVAIRRDHHQLSTNTSSLPIHMEDRVTSMNVAASATNRRPAARASGLSRRTERSSHASVCPKYGSTSVPRGSRKADSSGVSYRCTWR
jgi:NAD(P)-dependent dehydrogenase (short-subunit alcohol dehydrogenase family)